MEQALAEIRKTLNMMFYPDDVVELRSPRRHDVEFGKTVSGFFRDKERLAQALYTVNTKTQNTVYVTLNPVAPTWMGVDDIAYNGSGVMRQRLEKANIPLAPRMQSQTSWESGRQFWVMKTAEDGDIASRRWILIDIDAGQEAETNSTDTEHADTLAMANAVVNFLEARGFPKPALADSGNGHHVLVRVDLPNDKDSMSLVRRFLNALAKEFNGKYGTALVDEGMFNAGRITKAYGTLVFKGPATLERPRRWSRIINEASKRFATKSLIEEVAATSTLAMGNDWLETGPLPEGDLKDQVARMQDFLDFYDIEHHEPKLTDNDVVIPCTCPNADSHTMDGGELECVAFVRLSGELGFCCQHAHCQELRSWKGAKAWLEERDGKKFSWSGHGTVYLEDEPVLVEVTNLTQQERAIAILNSLKPSCTVAKAREMATAAGIPERTLRWAYDQAGMEFKRTKDEDLLVSF